MSVQPSEVTGITTVSDGEYLFGSSSILKYDDIEFGGLSDMTVKWDMKTSEGFNEPQPDQQLNIFWYGYHTSCGWGFIIRRHENTDAQDMYTVGQDLSNGQTYSSNDGSAFAYADVLPADFDWSVYHTYRVVKEGSKVIVYIDHYVFDLGSSMQATVETCPDKMKFGAWNPSAGYLLNGATLKNIQFWYSAQYRNKNCL